MKGPEPSWHRRLPPKANKFVPCLGTRRNPSRPYAARKFSWRRFWWFWNIIHMQLRFSEFFWNTTKKENDPSRLGRSPFRLYSKKNRKTSVAHAPLWWFGLGMSLAPAWEKQRIAYGHIFVEMPKMPFKNFFKQSAVSDDFCKDTSMHPRKWVPHLWNQRSPILVLKVFLCLKMNRTAVSHPLFLKVVYLKCILVGRCGA